jgi:hypothetical protein
VTTLHLRISALFLGLLFAGWSRAADPAWTGKPEPQWKSSHPVWHADAQWKSSFRGAASPARDVKWISASPPAISINPTWTPAQPAKAADAPNGHDYRRPNGNELSPSAPLILTTHPS